MSIQVGILSPFYHNYNYGGKLQAYALVRVISAMGYPARQIQYYQPSGGETHSPMQRLSRLLHSEDYRHAALQKGLGRLLLRQRRSIADRKAAFDRFDQQIPHTESVYSDKTLPETLGEFGAFVCGSDQIWNPHLFKKGYFLDFVPPDVCKFSYAASVAGQMPPEYMARIAPYLSKLDAISVREADCRQTLMELSGKDVTVSVDPTLLMTREEWDEIAEEPMVDGPYLLCYFLGYGGAPRRAAKAFARAKGLKIVTLPHLLGSVGRYYARDLGFGDVPLYDVSPAQFVGLIKHADCVLTDSFHATVMSLQYHRQFVVFDRSGFSGMGSRLAGLLELFDLDDRRCGLREPVDQVLDRLSRPIEYRQSYEKLEALRTQSMEYLRQNLKKAEDFA